MNKTALIGYTGFVGGNINAQTSFTDVYNTKNIDDIDGEEYDLVVSAATYAEMWRINQEPEKDLAQIEGLIKHLKNVKAKTFVLISTVGVYKDPTNIDEDTPIITDGLLPYGVNRYHLETFVRDNFSNSLIVRLPGLFGAGIKKNVIYDLLNNNNVDKIHHAGSYQYYDLSNIWHDINIALINNLKLINFATEPVKTSEVADYCFGIKNFDNAPTDVKPAAWDMHTKFAKFYGGSGNYIYSKQQVLDSIKKFVEAEKAKI